MSEVSGTIITQIVWEIIIEVLNISFFWLRKTEGQLVFRRWESILNKPFVIRSLANWQTP